MTLAQRQSLPGATMHGAEQPPRLGRVDYINVLPVYMGLELEGTGCTLVSGVPTDLNARLRGRDIDCAPVSAIEVAHARSGYAMLPGISISSRGAVGSSMLISKRAPHLLDGGSVALSSHSAASVGYFHILCRRLWRVAPSTVDAAPDLDAMLATHDGCVLIGNPAIVATALAQRRGDLVVTDLGAAWMEWTGLPCVFAVWAMWADWPAAHPQALRTLAGDLERGRAWGQAAAHRGALLQRAAIETGLPEPALDAYFDKQDYSLTSDHVHALERFFSELHALDLAPAPPALRFTA